MLVSDQSYGEWGIKFYKLGSKSCVIQLNNWKEWKAAMWNFKVCDMEVNQQLLNRKWKAGELETETLKQKRCEEDYKQSFKNKQA